MNIQDLISNPSERVILHWLQQILKGNVKQHEIILKRIAKTLHTSQDLEDFGKLMTSVYETAYIRAVEDYKTQLRKAGINIKVAIVPQDMSGE